MVGKGGGRITADPLYTKFVKHERSEIERYPTTLKPEEYVELPYEFVKLGKCWDCHYLKVCDMTIMGIYYCRKEQCKERMRN